MRLSIGVVALAVLLAGCMGSGAEFGARGSNARAPAIVQVMSKGFNVAGPGGFCVDDGATRESGDAAFVLLGSCAVISGNPRDAKPRLPAILTASVTAAGTPLDATALDRMAAFLTSPQGQAALARTDGTPRAEVLDISREAGLVLVHAQDDAHANDVAGDYWRGVFEVSGQLVTITVAGFRKDPLDERTGERLARDFVAAIRRANGAGATAAAAGAGDGLASLFNRLL